jgi:hypothetical protein
VTVWQFVRRVFECDWMSYIPVDSDSTCMPRLGDVHGQQMQSSPIHRRQTDLPTLTIHNDNVRRSTLSKCNTCFNNVLLVQMYLVLCIKSEHCPKNAIPGL